MSENLTTTTPVPRIIPPHPRYPGGRSASGKASGSESGGKQRLKTLAAAVDLEREAERAMVAGLSDELKSDFSFKDNPSRGLDVAEPESDLNPPAILSEPERLKKIEPVQPAVDEAAEEEVGVENADADEDGAQPKLSWLKRQRQSKPENMATGGEEENPLGGTPEAAEKKRGFWERLRERQGTGLAGVNEMEDGPAVEPWVEGIDENETAEFETAAEVANEPSVRATDAIVQSDLPQPRPRHFASKSHLVAMVGMACALVFGIWLFWQYDSAAPEDTNLVPVIAETGEANPVHTQLSHFLMRFRFDGNQSGMAGLKDYDTETLAELVRTNGSGLELILSCLAEKRWEPQHVAWRTGNLGGDLPWADLARVKQAEALYLQRSGKEVEAFRSAFDLMEFGRKIQEVEAWPNYFLTGLDIYHRGLDTVEQLVDDTRMNSGQLGALQRIFGAHLPPGESDLVAFYRASYSLEKAILEGESAPARPGSFPFHLARPEGILFKPNRTLELFADAFSSLIADASKPHYQRTPLDLSESESASILDSNRTGRQYFAKAIAPYLEISEQQALSVAHYEAVKTLFALRRHGLDLGRLPDTLADLGTKYLKAVPSDPFDGDSLRYSRYRKVVYSTGVDRIDSGGNPGRTGFSNRDEPTLEIPFSTGGDSEFH